MIIFAFKLDDPINTDIIEGADELTFYYQPQEVNHNAHKSASFIRCTPYARHTGL